MSEMELSIKVLALEVMLKRANERNGNLNVELAAMTQERDALRRENEQLRKETMALAWLASIHCSRDECCTKQQHDKPLDRGTCINCTIERARETIKASQTVASSGKLHLLHEDDLETIRTRETRGPSN